MGLATSKDPIGITDKALQLALPMFASDMSEVLQDNPELAPLAAILSSAGAGVQDYSKGSKFNKSKVWPKEWDIMAGAK